jgi:hypothetical protein
MDNSKSPILSQMKQHYRSTILHLERNQNERQILDELRQELSASLQLANILS